VEAEKANCIFAPCSERSGAIDKISKMLLKEIEQFVIRNNDDTLSLCHYLLYIQNMSDYSDEQINDTFIKTKNKVDDLINKGNFKDYILMLPKYSQVPSFQSILIKPIIGDRKYWDIGDKEYWEFLRLLWLKNDEPIFGRADVWYRLFSSKRPFKEYFMNEGERSLFDNLPDQINVYRGYIKDRDIPGKYDKMTLRLRKGWETFHNIGFSYSLLKEVGINYCNKYKIFENDDHETTLFKGSINKKEVFGFFDGKNEKEIIIVISGGYEF
jgi:hypothetical protein